MTEPSPPTPPTAGAARDGWDPAQYGRFSAERQQPFWDLAALLEPVATPRLVDLGCGDGSLTAALHDRLGASATLGLDSSAAMLEAAGAHAREGLRFEVGDLARWGPGAGGAPADIVVANASLHWVPDHGRVLARWRDALARGGQLAVQVPANADHPSHLVATEVAAEVLRQPGPPDVVARNVLAPDAYAVVLHRLGFARQQVRLQVYGHLLPSTADVVEWVRGTSLTRFRAVMDDDTFEDFVERYRRRLLAVLGDEQPYFYAFRRILIWARLP